jgi:hypothetical protein
VTDEERRQLERRIRALGIACPPGTLAPLRGPIIERERGLAPDAPPWLAKAQAAAAARGNIIRWFPEANITVR